MQLEECCKICVGADINGFIPYKEVKYSNIVPSSVVVSLTDHELDLALKSPSDITKLGSKLFILRVFTNSDKRLKFIRCLTRRSI